jgi:2-dehydro-3-deoxy-D-arabinonate dehydratase
MHLYKSSIGSVIVRNHEHRKIKEECDWDSLINRDDLHKTLKHKWESAQTLTDVESFSDSVLAPIGTQEVWASGVTYFSSRLARMEESQDSGGGDFYSRVYQADRPEIFLKATPSRVVGHKQSFRIREDSDWDVPEPELTLYATTSGKIVAYTIGNDVSSRSIEGENPLYLPQAKTYDKCACLGPCLYVPEEPISSDSEIALSIKRGDEEVYFGSTRLSEMKRTLEELVGYLIRETSFEQGVFLMTGTGVVPGNDFTLRKGDIVSITIDSIGTLVNSVE